MPAFQLRDYGGDSGGRKVKLSTDKVMSMRCQACQKLCYVPVMATTRAANPRCDACGGTLNELESSYKRRTGKTFLQAAKTVKSLGAKPYACPKCNKPFRSEVAMHLHFQESHAEA